MKTATGVSPLPNSFTQDQHPDQSSHRHSAATTGYKITSTGKLIDDALDAIEKENAKLKGVLNKSYTQLQIDPANLSSLIDLIATIPFQHADLHAKDILGHHTESSRSNPSSAPLGVLCAFAVQKSSMAIRGIDFDFGKEPANSFTNDQHPDLRNFDQVAIGQFSLSAN